MNPRGARTFKPNLIQIAGVTDEAEAIMLAGAGVDHIGFPIGLAHHGEDLTVPLASRVIRSIAPPARAVLITYLHRAADVAGLCRSLGVGVVQLHGDVEPGELSALRRTDPDLLVIKSVIVGRCELPSLRETIDAFAGLVDAFIADTYDPVTGATGATGKTHDWGTSRALAAYSPRPLILAGGLHAGNVGQAIGAARPAGVDAHTGVEDRTGRKSAEKVRRFVGEARRAFAALERESTNELS